MDANQPAGSGETPLAAKRVATLDESDVDPNPMRQFDRWFKEAIAAALPEPTAMTLATASRDGAPSARIVLLKDYGERGFVFFTNYESRKGGELAGNPRAGLVFHWVALERQVRVTGSVNSVSREESEKYFQSRPRASQIGAWASRQSEVISGRGELDARFERWSREFANRETIPLPANWGGYCVVPETVEFWQGQPSRLHDRLRYIRLSNAAWRIERLSP